MSVHKLEITIAAILTSLILILVGCATSSSHPPYPSEWPSINSLPSDDGCPKLTGNYSNRADAIFPVEAGTPPSLSDVFTHMAAGQGLYSPAASKQLWPTIPRDAAMVSIDQTSETMVITFIDASGNRTPLNFRRYHFSWAGDRVDDLFSCRTLYGEPTLRFFTEPQSHSGASSIGVSGGGAFVVMLKAVDGSLIVNWRSDSLGISLFVLGSGYHVNSLWYRYPLLDAQDEQTTTPIDQ